MVPEVTNLCYQACLTRVDIPRFSSTIADMPDCDVEIKTEPEREFGYLHCLSIKKSTDGTVLGLKSQVFHEWSSCLLYLSETESRFLRD